MMLQRFRLQTVKKVLIVVFITTTIWIQVATNLRIENFPISFTHTYSQVLNPIIYVINQGNWYVKRAAWLAGITNYWRMFSPVDRFNWHMIFMAVYPDGREQKLPLSTQMTRTLWQRNLTDFRDGKFHVNLYGHPEYRNYYSQYLCQQFSTPGHEIEKIRIDLEWQTIFDPDVAREREAYHDAKFVNTAGMGVFPCLNSSND